MKIKSLLKIIMILLISFGLVSCIKKLPTPSSKNDGVLVIAQDITNNTGKISGVGAAYWYSLSYSPANGPKIEIWPESNDLLLYKNFPAGKYRINHITLNPQNLGLKTYSEQKTFPVPDPMLPYYFFEIKPNHVTLLDARFIVFLDDYGEYIYLQNFEFTEITPIDREKTIEKLAKYYNSESWILPDKIEPAKVRVKSTKLKVRMKPSDIKKASDWVNEEVSRIRNMK